VCVCVCVCTASMNTAVKKKRREKEEAEDYDSDSSNDRPERDRTKKCSKRKRRQIRRGSNGSTLIAEKESLGSDPRKLIYSINADYHLVAEWVRRHQCRSNGHAGMADPDSDGDDTYDSHKATLFMTLDAAINNKESSDGLDVEKRDTTNYAYLRYVMSNKERVAGGGEDGYSIQEREEMRSVIYLSERKWEESYMRPPDKARDEQECERGDKCLGLRIQNSNGGFILVAYHFKQEVVESRLQNKPLPPNRMCIFCLRYETLKHYVESCADQRVYEKGTTIQIHRNSVSEYHPDFMIMGDPNMRRGLIDPIVIQTLSCTHYRYNEANGKKWYEQLIPRPTPDQLKHFLM